MVMPPKDSIKSILLALVANRPFAIFLVGNIDDVLDDFEPRSSGNEGPNPEPTETSKGFNLSTQPEPRAQGYIKHFKLVVAQCRAI